MTLEWRTIIFRLHAIILNGYSSKAIVYCLQHNYCKLWLLRAYYLLGTCFLPSIRHHLLSACVLTWLWQEIEWKPWHQEHAAHSMVILKSKKEELHRFFPLVANTKSHWATSFAAYDWTISPSKTSPIWRIEPHISPWVHNGCKSQSLREGWSLLILCLYLPCEQCLLIYCVLMPACRAWLSLHPLVTAYPLSGAWQLPTHVCIQSHFPISNADLYQSGSAGCC